jgi:hypothetical protein
MRQLNEDLEGLAEAERRAAHLEEEQMVVPGK